MKKQFIRDLKPGAQVDDIFYCSRRDVKERRDGGIFLTFELRDKTGGVNGIMWDRVDDALRCVEAGGFYRVQGKLGDYQGKPQLTVNIIYPADMSEVARDDFIAASRYNRDEMLAEIRGYIDQVENVHLHALLEAFFNDPKFVEQFVLVPAGARVHHAYLGGLLEHTVLMCRAARTFTDIYQELDRGLLMTGIILHDIGKINEYVYDIAIDHTYDGRLLGHLVMGCQMVEERIVGIKDFPDELSRMIRHIILAHHGQLDFGSPKTPKFVEAFVVYALDYLDSRIAIYREVVEKSKNTKWTDYNDYLESNVYIKDPAVQQ
jgi:3'-5' exoribonuclease